MSRYEPDPNIPDPPADRQQPEQEGCWTCGGTPPASGLPCICGGTNSHTEEVARLRLAVFAAEAQAAGLREALRKYGSHIGNCPTDDELIHRECHCGFRAALTEKEERRAQPDDVFPYR